MTMKDKMEPRTILMTTDDRGETPVWDEPCFASNDWERDNLPPNALLKVTIEPLACPPLPEGTRYMFEAERKGPAPKGLRHHHVLPGWHQLAGRWPAWESPHYCCDIDQSEPIFCNCDENPGAAKNTNDVCTACGKIKEPESEDARCPDCNKRFKCSPPCVRDMPEPKYRPWTRDEVPRGAWVRSIAGGSEYPISGVACTDGANLYVSGVWHTSEEMLADFTLLDGTPCGTLVTEES